MIKHNFKIGFAIAAILVLTLLVNGCKISYSFTGASISPAVKTVFVDYFANRARVVNPMLSQNFSEAMKDKFVNESGLSMGRDQGDLEFSGEITGYDVRPLSIQQNGTTGKDFASMNRLTITVKVVFTNNKDHTQDFNTTFTAYYDWESTQSLNSVESTAVEVIVAQLVDDIFNKSVANW
ncbi:MAG: LptE family protein [Mariniphaga sp.]